tara:strand:- start:481 stop:771 length:291 start_codon:yes stop_codon:yes gene_type:complete
MKLKPTFRNTRNQGTFWEYTDINNHLFKIMYLVDKKLIEKNYIFKNVKKNKDTIDYIYKKIKNQNNIFDIEIDTLSMSEYNLCLLAGVPTIYKCLN